MKRNAVIALILCALLLCLAGSSCADRTEKKKISVLIVPKFEIGEISGDFPGEAQLFYERYCPGCEEIAIEHLPAGARFYANEDGGTAILVTDSCKSAAALSLAAVLSSDLYDFSGAYIVSVGCGGGSAEVCTLGDVVVVTASCDYDLGHHVELLERERPGDLLTWFPDDSFLAYACKRLDADLCERVYELIRDCPLQTTETARHILEENFSDGDAPLRDPAVIRGTSVTGDNYWKGSYGHEAAKAITEYYGCADPYAVTEMEDISIANTAECFGLLDRVITLRVIVNMDIFLEGESPEGLWAGEDAFSEKVQEDNSETLDIFEPAMHNLADTAGMVIDALLAGTPARN